MSLAKNSCVGSLQVFTHTEAQEAASRYLHLLIISTAPASWGGEGVDSVGSGEREDASWGGEGVDSVGSEEREEDPINHWLSKCVVCARSCSVKAGKGPANSTRNQYSRPTEEGGAEGGGGGKFGKRDWRVRRDLNTMESRVRPVECTLWARSMRPSYPGKEEGSSRTEVARADLNLAYVH